MRTRAGCIAFADQPISPYQMKAFHILPLFAGVFLFACNTAPATPAAQAPPPTTTVAPVDTVINRYERKEVKQITADTTKVAEPK